MARQQSDRQAVVRLNYRYTYQYDMVYRMNETTTSLRPTHATGLPTALACAPLGVLRPRDGLGVYTQPSVQFHRLTRRGVLRRIAPGFYAIVPPAMVGTIWKPTLEGAAAGIAAAEFGPHGFALMGISAARLHGAIPRATGLATVATPRRRQALTTLEGATVVFTPVNLKTSELERMGTDLGDCLVTTPEQTALDISHRPALVGDAGVADAAMRALWPRCDQEVLARIAACQRRTAALGRLMERMGS
jgi:predicted transcriptional regulator of viral defense system